MGCLGGSDRLLALALERTELCPRRLSGAQKRLGVRRGVVLRVALEPALVILSLALDPEVQLSLPLVELFALLELVCWGSVGFG